MFTCMVKRGYLLLLISVLFAMPGTLAQNVGSLQGTVVDPAGQTISGVQVKLVDLANNTERTAATDSEGAFGFVQLNPGIYRLEASKDGFRTHVEERVSVLVATPTHVDINLELGSVTEQITVEAAATPALNTNTIAFTWIAASCGKE